MAVRVGRFIRSIAANVRRFRELEGITQEELAARCDWDYRHVQRIEAGDIDSISAIVRVANAFKKVTPEQLFRVTEPIEKQVGRPKKKPARGAAAAPTKAR